MSYYIIEVELDGPEFCSLGEKVEVEAEVFHYGAEYDTNSPEAWEFDVISIAGIPVEGFCLGDDDIERMSDDISEWYFDIY